MDKNPKRSVLFVAAEPCARRGQVRLSTRQTALELGMSVKTVETHRQRIKGKLRCVPGSELLRSAVLLQTAEPPPATSGNGRLTTTGGSGRADR